MTDTKTLNAQKVSQFKEALKLLQATAKELASVDKSKLEDSEDKFLVIRAVRIDHAIRETLSGKSLKS